MSATATSKPTGEQRAMVHAAADAVHAATCAVRAEHDPRGCRTWGWLATWATLHAVQHLQASPRDAAGARRIYHDATCVGGADCSSRDDHAKRTQSKTVAALRKHVLTLTPAP